MCCSGSRDILMQNILCFTSSQDSSRANLTQSRHLNPPWGVWRGQDLWSWCRTSDISLIPRNRIGLPALLSHKSGLCVDDPGVSANHQNLLLFWCLCTTNTWLGWGNMMVWLKMPECYCFSSVVCVHPLHPPTDHPALFTSRLPLSRSGYCIYLSVYSFWTWRGWDSFSLFTVTHTLSPSARPCAAIFFFL